MGVPGVERASPDYAPLYQSVDCSLDDLLDYVPASGHHRSRSQSKSVEVSRCPRRLREWHRSHESNAGPSQVERGKRPARWL